MFSKSAKYYDEIYAAVKKDYAAEVNKLRKLIQKHKQTGGVRLLDVACGTGAHASLLNEHFHVEGLDLDAGSLSVARRKCPGAKFHHADMVDFQLKSRFDVITCLFSSIGYTRTKSRLQKAIRNMVDHLVPGGVLIV
ncbi:MAG: class I SAM-dependent methyltransferase, partial [Chloroflexota bacterium]